MTKRKYTDETAPKVELSNKQRYCGAKPRLDEDEWKILAYDMVDFFDSNHDSLSFHQWLIRTRISHRMLYDASRKYEFMCHAMDLCKSKIKVNRDILACRGKLPLPMWQRGDHYYEGLIHAFDEEIKEADSERRKKENSSLPANDSVITEDLELRKEIATLKADIQRYKRLLNKAIPKDKKA